MMLSLSFCDSADESLGVVCMTPSETTVFPRPQFGDELGTTKLVASPSTKFALSPSFCTTAAESPPPTVVVSNCCATARVSASYCSSSSLGTRRRRIQLQLPSTYSTQKRSPQPGRSAGAMARIRRIALSRFVAEPFRLCAAAVILVCLGASPSTTSSLVRLRRFLVSISIERYDSNLCRG